MKRICALLILLGLLLLLGTAGRSDCDVYAEPEDRLSAADKALYISSAVVMMAVGGVGIKITGKDFQYDRI